MRHFVSRRHLGLILLALLLEQSLPPFLFSLNARPDLLYLVVLDYAFFWSWDRVPFFAMFVGLARDFLGGHLFGIGTVSFSVTGWVLSLGMQKLERDVFWVRMAITFLFAVLTGTLSVLLGVSLETSRGFQIHFIGSVLGTTGYTTLAAPLFFWFTHHWFRRTSVLKQYELF